MQLAQRPGPDRPLIGISSYAEDARFGTSERPAVLLPRRYVDKVVAAGGTPVLLPPVPGIEAAAGRLDGLLLSGGGDIDPVHYGAEPHPANGPVRADRDAAEFALFAAARRLGLPVLGICRGIQVINVALGGTLHQHLPDLVGDQRHAPVSGGHGLHDVRLATGSRLHEILGRPGAAGWLPVPTHHHQAIDRLGAGLSATAWADDETIEAVELDPAQHPAVLAVQWHPETSDDLRLFRWLVTTASRELAGALG
jgi:gamma-glutamyl-gamma-aminobutyrate hydrolase PuuD